MKVSSSEIYKWTIGSWRKNCILFLSHKHNQMPISAKYVLTKDDSDRALGRLEWPLQAVFQSISFRVGHNHNSGRVLSIPAKSPSVSYHVYLLIFSFHFRIQLKWWIYHVSNVLQWKIKIWQFWPNYDYGLVNTAAAGAVMKLFQHESDANSALIPQLVLFAPIQH